MKYIFLDIDGTLVNREGKLPGSAREALIRAKSRGHKLILATGRCKGQIYPWLLEAVEFDGILGSSGANIHWQGKRVFSRFMRREDLLALEEKYRAVGAYACWHLEDHLISTPEDFAKVLALFERCGISRSEIDTLFGGMELVTVHDTPDVEKSVYFDSGRTLEFMRTHLGDGFLIDPYSYPGVPSTAGEVTLGGVNKALGVRALCEHLGADIADTIAFGDGGNDVSMLGAVHTGVAMGNAGEALKAVADVVTDPIDEDGLWNALVHFGLI